MFPVTQAPLAMKIVMYANPLTYGQELMVGLMSGNLESTLLPFGVMLGISLAMMCLLLFACYRLVNQSPRGVH